jgi:N6-L-threonylcarbamoyladenine synthase
MVRILAIESSCDETAAAVIRDGRWVEGSAIASQIPLHQAYGGIVPEVASRAHVQAVVPVIRDAMEQAEVGWDDLDVIVGTRGPGLAGSLLIGLNAAKAIAYARGLPFVGVNHLEGHIYSNWLEPASEESKSPPAPEFPLLCLIVSGGHTDLVLMRDHGDLVRLGRTRDDAAGEAFDKVARILGLGFPGGPIIQKQAEGGDPTRHPISRAWLKGTHDFSFSGVKTATLRLVESFAQSEVPVADVAASFQESVADVLSAKAVAAVQEYDAKQLAVCGGVAANRRLRELVQERSPVPVRLPALKWCTDNAAMIGAAGFFAYQRGTRSALDLDATANLPIA